MVDSTLAPETNVSVHPQLNFSVLLATSGNVADAFSVSCFVVDVVVGLAVVYSYSVFVPQYANFEHFM